MCSLDGRSGTNTSAIPRERSKQAWKGLLDEWRSFDARILGSTSPPFEEENKRAWRER